MGAEGGGLETGRSFLLLLAFFVLLAILVISPQGRVDAAPTSPPTVQSDAATRNLPGWPNQYILNGQITDTGGGDCGERGFDYRKQGDDTWLSWTETGVFGAGSFHSDPLTTLEKGAVYAVQAKARNSVGWGYGAVLTFRVISEPTVTTEGATDITSSSATLHGTLAGDGGESCSRRGFYYRQQGMGGGTPVYEDGSFSHVTVFADGFEDGSLEPFETAGDALWTVADREFYTAPYAAESGKIGDGQSTTLSMKIEMPEDGTVRFARKVSSDKEGDFLVFLVDDVEQDGWAGEVAWAEVSYSLTKGEHKLAWRYQKDGSDTAGSDAAWVDEVCACCPDAYSITATGLQPGTTYEYYAYAVNLSYYGYGGLKTFTTAPVAPTVRTDPASEITGDGARLNGFITDLGGAACDERGFDYREAGGIWKEWKESGSFGAEAFSTVLSGLDPNTDYEFKAKAHNSAGWGSGSTLTLHTSVEPPGVRTDPATGITADAVTLNADITSLGGMSCDLRGFAYREQGTLTWTQWDEGGTFATGPFSTAIGGLDIGTTYEFYSFARNGAGTTFGDTLTFTTDDVPGVDTLAASGVAADQATLNGDIASTGGADCDERGFDYRAQGAPVWSSWTETGTFGTGSFSRGLTGLDPGKTYEFRARAHNSVGWGYGDVLTFTTTAVQPVVITDPATGIYDRWAQLNGRITDPGASSCDERGFDYRVQGETVWQSWTETHPSGYGAGAFSHILTGLTSGVTYEFRAKAHNTEGWGYGEVESFTTLHPATVHTDPATGVDTDSAVLGGEITDTGGDYCDYRGVQLRRQGETEWGGGWSEGPGTYYTGHFSQEMSGLEPGTTYEYRAWARNWWCDYTYAEILTFRTAVPPQARSDAASAVATTTATLNGCIADAGGENCDQRGFDYRVQGETTWQEWTEAGSFPVGVALQDGFEDGELLPFRTGWTGAPWAHDAAVAHTGSWSMRSGAIPDEGESDLYTYQYDCSRISFALKVSSEEGYDFLVLYMNEGEIGRWSGELDWQAITLDLPPGSHEFRFAYEKDGSLSAGSDCAWVDDVLIDHPYGHGLDGLLPDTAYEFRAKAHNSAGWGYGDILTFTTSGVPEVGTAAATGVAADAATLNGEVVHQGSAPCDQRGFEYRRMGEDTWSEWTEGGSFGPGTYTHDLGGLANGAGYSFRAKAHNAEGWGYGETLSFSTLNAPTVTTDAATGVGHDSATLNATVLSAGGSSVSEVGFRYRAWGETAWQQWTGPGSGAGSSLFADGFEDRTWAPFTVWYGGENWFFDGDDTYEGVVSARCSGMGDKGYDETDLSLVVDVPAGGYRILFAHKESTEAGHDVLNFYINGSIVGTWSGENPWQEAAFDLDLGPGHYTFEWKFFKDAGEAGQDAVWIDDVSIESTAPFDHGLTGLEQSTPYEFQAFATNANGTGDGDILTFKTLGPSTSQTDSAGGVTTTSAVLNGQITDGGGENCDQRGFEYREAGETAWREWSEAGSYFAFSEDFEDGWIDLGMGGWGAGTDPHWYLMAGGYGGSAYCARSGAVVPGGANYMELTDQIPEPGGRVTFARRVSCQPGSAWLFFGYQGAPWISWDGEVAWGTVGYDLEPGMNNIGWRYQKLGGAVPQGEDAAFVDDIVISAVYAHELTGLEPNTTYEFRAASHNGTGWNYGETRTFRTLAAPPKVTTGAAGGVTADSATMVGNIADTGSGACDRRGFDYRRAGESAWRSWTESGSFGTGSFSHAVGGLEADTTYEYRAKAHGVGGWGYGQTGTFVTKEAGCAFYFAEGYTGPGFAEYLCLGNPEDAALEVAVTYLFKDGTTKQEAYSVPGRSRHTVNVNSAVGADKEVSMKCEAARPFVAERPMYFNYAGAWTGGHDVVGATGSSDKWYFAEGYTGSGFEEWICVLNPGDAEASLTFRFQTQEAGEKVITGYAVPAHSRGSFKANELLEGGSYQASLKLEATCPVVAERPMYFDYTGRGDWHWTGGHCVMGVPSLSTECFFAEGCTRRGFEEWLTLQNPGAAPIDIQATYMLETGETVEVTHTVPAAWRSTVYVPEVVGPGHDVSVHLTCPSPFLAERPMYFDYQGTNAWHWTGGHCVIGSTAQSTKWFFAEGYTGSGFEEWICIQNAGDEAAHVTVTYYPEGGANPLVREQPPVAPKSRWTVPVNKDAGDGMSISAEVSSDRPIICERPMYFSYGAGGWTGGHDVAGYVP